MQEHFQALGLDPNSQYSPEDLKKVYRELSKTHHPDKGGNKERFQAINHSYQMLTDPSYREQHLKTQVSVDFNVQVPVSFEDAFFGRTVTCTYNQIELDDSKGVVVKKHQDIITVALTYPMGHMQGYLHTVPGGGLKHRDRVGNAQIQFMVKNHPKFQTDGSNIITQEQVELETMLKGGVITVQTMYGIKEVKVRPGTSPGQQIPIKGYGVRRSHAHIVVVNPIYPSERDLKDKKQFSGLDIHWGDFEEPEAPQPAPSGYYITFGA